MKSQTPEDTASTPSLPNEPLPIRVTQPAQENLVFRTLVRQVLPMLRNPEAHSRDAMRGLAQTLEQALDSSCPNYEENTKEDQEFDFTDAEDPFEESGDCWDCGCSCE